MKADMKYIFLLVITSVIAVGSKAECDCGIHSYDCIFDEQGYKTCICNFGFAQKGDTCEECHCGSQSKCSFKPNGEKLCLCPEGSAEFDGMCKECDCGSNSLCIFDIYGDKKCYCLPGFAKFKGICKECDCGPNTTCSFDAEGKKMCVCEEGFIEFSGECKECVCGVGYVCSFDTVGNKKCKCEDGLAEFNGTCKVCSCGRNSICEFNSQGRQECLCRVGFKEHYASCRECYCGYDIRADQPINCSFDMYGYKRCECPDRYVDINGRCESHHYLFRCKDAICVRYEEMRGIACTCNDYKDLGPNVITRETEQTRSKCVPEVVQIVRVVSREVPVSAVFLGLLLGVILSAFLVLAHKAFKKQKKKVYIDFIEKGKR